MEIHMLPGFNIVNYFYFERCKVLIDEYSVLLFGNPVGEDNTLIFNEKVTDMLCKKFKKRFFDSFDNKENDITFFKFFILYSPILKKLVDEKEFDEIKVNKHSINVMSNVFCYIYTGGNCYYQCQKIRHLDNHIVLSDKNFKI